MKQPTLFYKFTCTYSPRKLHRPASRGRLHPTEATMTACAIVHNYYYLMLSKYPLLSSAYLQIVWHSCCRRATTACRIFCTNDVKAGKAEGFRSTKKLHFAFATVCPQPDTSACVRCSWRPALEQAHSFTVTRPVEDLDGRELVVHLTSHLNSARTSRYSPCGYLWVINMHAFIFNTSVIIESTGEIL